MKLINSAHKENFYGFGDKMMVAKMNVQRVRLIIVTITKKVMFYRMNKTKFLIFFFHFLKIIFLVLFLVEAS